LEKIIEKRGAFGPRLFFAVKELCLETKWGGNEHQKRENREK
jgi:hypothetical protein